MKQNRYESPKMTFVNLHANEAIANRCWAYAKVDGDDPLFYDTPNAGYVQFSVYGASNCGANNPDLQYTITSYIKPNDADWTEEEKKAANTAFNDWFETEARPGGSSFKGAGYSEDMPGGDWS